MPGFRSVGHICMYYNTVICPVHDMNGTPVFFHWQVCGGGGGRGGEGGWQWLGMGLLYTGPGYEAIICFTHCKQSN